MRETKLTTQWLALKNIFRQPARSISLAGVTALLTLVLIGGSLLAAGLLRGAESISARLGADAIIVPAGYDASAQGALLRGEPSAFFFDGDTAARLQSAAGIEKATGQLMIASFDSIHCAAAVQIIGFDPWTDFVVAPWIKQELPNGLANGEIVVGSDVVGEPGGTLVFFKRPYIVAAKLRKTGMGFDTSVFINMATARIALEDYAALGGKCPPAEVDPVSSILVNIEPGVDAKNFALDLMQEYGRDKVSVILTRAMVADISQNMHAMLVIIAALIALLWFMAVFVQAVMVGAIINERKRELGIYRVLGATQGKLISLLLTESAIVSAAGAIIGAALCAFLYFSFARLIGLSIHTPYLMPESGAILRLISGGLVLAFLTGPVAALLSTRRAGKKAVETVLTGGR